MQIPFERSAGALPAALASCGILESQKARKRWEIEVFFKTLNQHLKVKTFIGTTENALRIQIWTALIALLLLKYLHHLSKLKWSLSNLATMLRLNLFTYRDLTEWLNDPFSHPPLTPQSSTQLFLSGIGQPISGA